MVNGNLVFKISEAVEKITNPGLKKVYRVYNEKGRAIADFNALLREVPDTEEPLSLY